MEKDTHTMALTSCACWTPPRYELDDCVDKVQPLETITSCYFSSTLRGTNLHRCDISTLNKDG
jgi:hypothetical protein